MPHREVDRDKEKERKRLTERDEGRQHLRIVVGKFHFQLAVFAIFACIRQSVWPVQSQTRGQLGPQGGAALAGQGKNGCEVRGMPKT